MDLYTLTVFVHVLGAVTLFAAWGFEAAAIAELRRRGVRGGERSVGFARLRLGVRLAQFGMLTALATGAWMMWVRWGQQAWMSAAIIGLVVMVVIGVVASRRARLRQAAAGPAAIQLLASSLIMRASIGVGIVGLMTAKPAAIGSTLMLVASVALGVGLIASRRLRQGGGKPRARGRALMDRTTR
jgi:hypothetical protein